MIYKIGHGSATGVVHFGETLEPSSVRCGNYSEEYGVTGLTWSDDQLAVTCKSCLKLLSRANLEPRNKDERM